VKLETFDINIKPFGSGQNTKSRHVPIGRNSRTVLWKYLIERDPALPEPVFVPKNAIVSLTRNSACHLIQGFVQQENPGLFSPNFQLYI
jgi:site-specific recombinase XerD